MESKMAIKTSTFSGVVLTGESADAFRNQFIENPKSSPFAQASLSRVKALAKEIIEKDAVDINKIK